jgi:type VII secretion-associated protein (TIGR03931 family)
MVADRLRAKGITVVFADRDTVRRAALETLHAGSAEDVDVPLRVSRGGHRVAVLAGIMATVALCAGFAMRGSQPDVRAGEVPMTLLVEGRVAIMVPAAWRVQRITAGPGSARVQIVSSTDADVAVHLTQSPGVPGTSLAMAADSLRSALSEEPGGVFVDFNPSDRRADRPAVTYQEIRQGRRVEWVVLVEDSVRIAIGCQSPVGREDLVRDVCERAIRSAHAIF